MLDRLIPDWADRFKPLAAVGLVLAPVYLVAMLYYGGSAETWAVGYSPKQPVPFSHKLHAGELGLDCRYCHTTVETAAMAAIPPTATCMNCHAHIAPTSRKLLVVRASASSGKPIPWVRVHNLPDFVYFNHSVHVRRGVSCVWCHGRIDQMERVYQAKPLTMSWCLDCHRHPEERLRPPEFVTDLGWVPEEDPAVVGQRVRAELHIDPPTDCSTCHR